MGIQTEEGYQMPTTKLGSSSHTAVNDLQMKHYDLDRKIGETLSVINLDVKSRLAARLPAIVDQIQSEMTQTQQEV